MKENTFIKIGAIAIVLIVIGIVFSSSDTYSQLFNKTVPCTKASSVELKKDDKGRETYRRDYGLDGETGKCIDRNNSILQSKYNDKDELVEEIYYTDFDVKNNYRSRTLTKYKNGKIELTEKLTKKDDLKKDIF